jgi:hypothetical protein
MTDRLPPDVFGAVVKALAEALVKDCREYNADVSPECVRHER